MASVQQGSSSHHQKRGIDRMRTSRSDPLYKSRKMPISQLRIGAQQKTEWVPLLERVSSAPRQWKWKTFFYSLTHRSDIAAYRDAVVPLADQSERLLFTPSASQTWPLCFDFSVTRHNSG